MLGTSFTALDINLAVTLHRLEELGYGSLLSDKPGLQQFFSKVQLRPIYQESLTRRINVIDVMEDVHNLGSAPFEDLEKELKRTSSLPSQKSLEDLQKGSASERSIDNKSSPEPSSGIDGEDEKQSKQEKKKQRKRQNEDRTWYSLW